MTIQQNEGTVVMFLTGTWFVSNDVIYTIGCYGHTHIYLFGVFLDPVEHN
jgi:hypothetical protein